MPEISITEYTDILRDEHGHFYVPATVTLTWPNDGELPGPVIRARVNVPARADMTFADLQRAHLKAALEALTASLTRFDVNDRGLSIHSAGPSLHLVSQS